MRIKALLPVIIIFSILTGIEIYGELLFDSKREVIILFVTKPLLMPILMFLIWHNTKLSTTFTKLVFGGFVFGWIGDILLMFNSDDLFVFGLASFLICHICYIAAFVYNIRKSEHKLSLGARLILGLLPLFYLIVLYSYLYPHIVGKEESKPFLIPVSVYAVTIVTMCLFALWRIGTSNRKSVALIIMGAFTFIISDSLIAMDKFVAPFKYASLFIMFTYCLAQLWIAAGSIQHHLATKK